MMRFGPNRSSIGRIACFIVLPRTIESSSTTSVSAPGVMRPYVTS